MKREYTYIVVLAPGITVREEGRFGFKTDAGVFRYDIAGDPFEFRFKAVAKLYTEKRTQKFLLVGGPVKTKEPISKPEVMKQRLETKYSVPSESLTIVKSSANTEGNAIAINQHLSCVNLSADSIGLLTNFYHLSRAIRIFIEFGKLRLIPISAESVIYQEEYENIREFYNSEGFSRILDTQKEHNSEIKGMEAIEEGIYTSGTS